MYILILISNSTSLERILEIQMFYFEAHIHEQNILTLMWKQTKYMYKC